MFRYIRIKLSVSLCKILFGPRILFMQANMMNLDWISWKLTTSSLLCGFLKASSAVRVLLSFSRGGWKRVVDTEVLNGPTVRLFFDKGVWNPGRIIIGRGKKLPRKAAFSTLCPTHIPRELRWNWTWVSVVRNSTVNAWRNYINLGEMYLKTIVYFIFIKFEVWRGKYHVNTAGVIVGLEMWS